MGGDSKKKVSFDKVQVREYPIVLSLNPAGHYGPAIEIGWEYRLASEVPPLKHVKYEKKVRAIQLDEGGRVPVKEYERIRPSSFRRDEQRLYLFVNQRENYVKTNNFTDAEIQEATKKKEALYLQRKRSNLRGPLVQWKEGAAASRRTKKVKRAVRNLEKKNGDSSHDRIYSGWWLPLSAYIF